MASPDDYLTLVESFDLLVPFDEFSAVVTAVMKRLEAEGVPSLASMQFYQGSEPGRIGAVIRFSNADHLDTHIAMISGWDEFERFSKMIKVVDIRIFGKVTPAAEAFVRSFDGHLEKAGPFVAGFVRSA